MSKNIDGTETSIDLNIVKSMILGNENDIAEIKSEQAIEIENIRKEKDIAIIKLEIANKKFKYILIGIIIIMFISIIGLSVISTTAVNRYFDTVENFELVVEPEINTKANAKSFGDISDNSGNIGNNVTDNSGDVQFGNNGVDKKEDIKEKEIKDIVD